MKKIIVAAAAVIMIIMLAGCSSTSPSEVVKANFENLKMDTETGIDMLGIDEQTLEDNQSLNDNYEKCSEMLQDFDYEITDEQIDGNKATVTVIITTYPFGDSYVTSVNKILNVAQDWAVLDDPPDESDQNIYVAGEILNGLSSSKEKTYTQTVEVNLTKRIFGGWEMGDNDELTNAVYGGLQKGIESVAAMDTSDSSSEEQS